MPNSTVLRRWLTLSNTFKRTNRELRTGGSDILLNKRISQNCRMREAHPTRLTTPKKQNVLAESMQSRLETVPTMSRRDLGIGGVAGIAAALAVPIVAKAEDTTTENPELDPIVLCSMHTIRPLPTTNWTGSLPPSPQKPQSWVPVPAKSGRVRTKSGRPMSAFLTDSTTDNKVSNTNSALGKSNRIKVGPGC